MANRIRYLRISLLQACNFNCLYCRPLSNSTERHRYLTSPEKFKAAIAALHEIGIRKVRFTGGEPTLYPRLAGFIEYTKSLSPTVHAAMTTNGRWLQKLIPGLAEAGLDSVNVSLDTLDRKTFRQITAHDDLHLVLSGIETAIGRFPSVKLNCVVMGEINAHEAAAMVAYANELGVDVRFIEYMPSRHSNTQQERYVSSNQLRKQLPYDFYPLQSDIHAAARYYRCDDLRIRVGFIEAVSHPFCKYCDRLRLTAGGNLYSCLFSNQAFNLFEMLSDRRDRIHKEIDQLVIAWTNLGCSALLHGRGYLPSFVVTGG